VTYARATCTGNLPGMTEEAPPLKVISQLRFKLDSHSTKKSVMLPFLTTNGANGVVANQRRVGGAFE
jgi:hypothetical protein